MSYAILCFLTFFSRTIENFTWFLVSKYVLSSLEILISLDNVKPSDEVIKEAP